MVDEEDKIRHKVTGQFDSKFAMQMNSRTDEEEKAIIDEKMSFETRSKPSDEQQAS